MVTKEVPEQDPSGNHVVEIPEITATAGTSEQAKDVPTESSAESSENLKTFEDVAMQTEPLPCQSPIIYTVTPGTKQKRVEQDHSYAKKKLEFLPVHAEASFMPTTIVKDEDSSDDENDDIDKIGTDCNSYTSDEDCVPYEDDDDSDDENPVNSDDGEIETNWLRETDDPLKEKKTIVFDSRLMPDAKTVVPM